MTQHNGAAGSPIIPGSMRAVFYALMIGIALLEVFVTFRGLRSAAGMEQAQLAREVARGNGWTTKCVRPAVWKQLLDHKPDTGLAAVPDTTTPPLPALLLAPLFKLAESSWLFQPARDGVVYLLDRIAAAVGGIFMLLLLLNVHGLARTLFDEKVAVVTAVAAGFCDPLWELAVSGSPRMLLALELVVALRLALAVLQRQERGEPGGMPALSLGLMLATLPLTHRFGWLWALLILGWLVLAAPRRALRSLPLAGAPLAVLLVLTLARNISVTGELLGSATLGLRAVFSTSGEELTARGFNDVTAMAGVPQIVRVTTLRLAAQWAEIYQHLGLMLGALFFPLALAHRFRRRECRLMAWLLAALAAGSSLAMAMLGPVTELENEHNVLLILAPLLAVFGTALAAMLWMRWHAMGRTFMERWGHAIVLIAVTAFPLLGALPDSLRGGLVLRGHLSQWPPYAADRVAPVRKLLDDDEVLLADAPWFTAWYTDTTSIWMPAKRTELPALKAAVEAADRRVAGIVITPVSARADYLGQLFNGPWGEWPDLIVRGPLLAFDRELKPWPDLPYQVAIPLIGFSTGDTEGLGLLMAFYTDRQREARK